MLFKTHSVWQFSSMTILFMQMKKKTEKLEIWLETLDTNWIQHTQVVFNQFQSF